MAGQLPADAQEVPRTDDPQDTGHLHHSFIGSRLLGIYGDGDPYMLRFENGGVVTVMYDYPYSAPSEGTPFWTLHFHTPDLLAQDDDFRQHVQEVCTEEQQVDIQTSHTPDAGRYARRAIAALLVLALLILKIQLYSQPPTWIFSLPICWFFANLYYIGWAPCSSSPAKGGVSAAGYPWH